MAATFNTVDIKLLEWERDDDGRAKIGRNEADKIRRRRREGESVAALAAESGVTPATIYNVLQAAGHGSPGRPKRQDEARPPEGWRERAAQEKTRALASTLDVNGGIVGREGGAGCEGKPSGDRCVYRDPSMHLARRRRTGPFRHGAEG